MVVGVLGSHHDLVNLVSTHNKAFVDQLRRVVIDIPQMDLDSACTCGWRLTLVTIAMGKHTVSLGI